MTKLKWGVLGCSSFARRRTIPAMLQSPSVELVGIASRTPEKAESFRAMFNLPRAYGSYQEMLADPGIKAVYNPLPNGLHGEWMIKAAEYGKHTLCEKPFASDAGEAAAVTRIASERGVRVMEGFMWRLHSQHLRATSAIQEGTIGRVRLVRAAFTYTILREPNARLKPDLAGGSVMDVGCYTISAARFYFGEEPVRVFARGHRDPEYGVDMWMSGILEFPSGRANIDCGFDLPYRTEVEITGDTGRILIPRPWLPDPEAVIYINGKEEKLPPDNQYVNEFEHFSQCVLNGKSPQYAGEDAILQMRAVDAVRRSMESGVVEAV